MFGVVRIEARPRLAIGVERVPTGMQLRSPARIRPRVVKAALCSDPPLTTRHCCPYERKETTK